MSQATETPPQDKIGEWLVNLGMITRRQLAVSMEVKDQSDATLEATLVEQRFISEDELNGCIKLQQILGTIPSLGDFPVEDGVIPLVPEPVAKQKVILPLMKLGDRLVIAYGRSTDAYQRDYDVKLLDQVSHLTGLMVVGVGFKKEDVMAAIEPLYGKFAQTGIVDAAMKLSGAMSGSSSGGGGKQVTSVDAKDGDGEAPIVELVNSILSKAIETGASDLHLEPYEQRLDVRLRMDGVCTTIMQLPKQVEGAMINRVKILCDMNIAERRRPQDGRFSVRHQGQKIDFRVAVIACHWGEKVVMRLLRPKTIALGLSALGFSEAALEKLDRYINAPCGLMLVTGPTGSGKTSTLYASLSAMDKYSDSIVTIEDPVEFPVEGITQIQANAKIGLTFAAALKTILRLDPDTIMLGEIRDRETGEIAMEAALTGHMVLSTLHTNSTVETVGRLIEMGLPPHMVAATLLCVVAQRLVRKVCKACYYEYPATPEEEAFVAELRGEEAGTPLTLATGKGCDICNNTGHKGQLGVFEILEVTRTIKRLINSHEDSLVMLDAAQKNGMLTLLQDGKLKALQKMTSVAEVQRVLGMGLKDD